MPQKPLARPARPTVLALVLAIFALCFGPSQSVGSSSPVKVENIRRAFHNGEHNAFTDLIRWRGKYWLAFRSCPDGHGVYSTSSVIVLSSRDAKSWAEAFRFSVPDRDVRDPHFLEFGEKLFVYCGTWDLGKNHNPRDWNALLGYAVATADGSTWTEPRVMEGTYGHFVWRAAAHGGKAYLCARRWREHRPGMDRIPMESALLESDDGFSWRFVSLFQETLGNETAFLFEPDGELIALCRSQNMGARPDAPSVLARSRPPYERWSRESLPGFIGGPMLARWQNRLIAGGRRMTPAGYRTQLMWLTGNQLVPFAELPSDGDNSYPGFTTLEDGRGLVSWYSSHERDANGKPITAIYLAELAIGK